MYTYVRTYIHICIHTVYTLTFAGLNFRGLSVFVIFAVCDIIALALPVRSEYTRDETFVDGY